AYLEPVFRRLLGLRVAFLRIVVLRLVLWPLAPLLTRFRAALVGRLRHCEDLHTHVSLSHVGGLNTQPRKAHGECASSSRLDGGGNGVLHRALGGILEWRGSFDRRHPRRGLVRGDGGGGEWPRERARQVDGARWRTSW